jgi:hypothetical protein
VLTERTNRLGTRYYEDDSGVVVAKQCRKCNRAKPLDIFSPEKNGLGGRTSKCKECVASITRKKRGYETDSYRPNVEIKAIDGVAGKPCTKCKVWKPLADYAKRYNGLGGKGPDCRECRAIYNSENKERIAERGREYHKNNPEMSSLKTHRRRARMMLLPDDFTSEQMQVTFEYFGGCALTGDVSDVHWDHAIPIAVGWGGTTCSNMIPLRSDLNLSKHDKNIFEWFEANRQRFNLDQQRFDRLIEWLGKANNMTVEEYRDYVYSCFKNKRSIDDALAI